MCVPSVCVSVQRRSGGVGKVGGKLHPKLKIFFETANVVCEGTMQKILKRE